MKAIRIVWVVVWYLKTYLLTRYENANLTKTEAQSIILQLKTLSSADLYESNKKIMQWLADGFILKREDRSQKDIHISLLDYAGLDRQRQSENLDIIAAEPSAQYPPYLLALRIKPSHYWNISVRLIRKAGCWVSC